MTYCVALRLDAGILFASDSRTNAGVDHVATFSKMKVFERKDERVMVLLCAGNLSVTQSVTNLLEQHKNAEPGRASIWSVGSLFDVACLVGDALREVNRRDGPYLSQGNVDAGASLILGGQIKGEDQRLFHIYAQGNFIEATYDTIYFQLGESKYGKPVLDRVVTPFTLQVLHCPVGSFAARCLALSFFAFSGYASRTSSIIFCVSLIIVLIFPPFSCQQAAVSF